MNPNASRINSAAQRDDPQNVMSHYRRIVRFRHANQLIAAGAVEWVEMEHPHLFAYRRLDSVTQLTIVANCSSFNVAVPPRLIVNIEGAHTIELDYYVGEPVGPTALLPWRSLVVIE